MRTSGNVGYGIGVLDQGGHVGLRNRLNLRADLPDLSKLMRKHLADDVLQNAGIRGHADIGQGRGRQQEATDVHVLGSQTPIERFIRLGLTTGRALEHGLADRIQHLKVRRKEKTADLDVSVRQGMSIQLGGYVKIIGIPLLITCGFFCVRGQAI